MLASTAQLTTMINMRGMDSVDDIIMPLATLRVQYGIDIEGNSITAVSWTDPETGKTADHILRNGIIGYLQELEAAEVFEGWDD